MSLRNSPAGYGLVAQLLHWTVAGLIVYQYVLAEQAADATLFQKLGILATHKSVGITILSLAALRLIWSFGVGPRPLPPRNEPAFRRRLAAVSHAALYVLIIFMPVTGWILSSATNTPVSVFGMLTLPDLIRPQPGRVDALRSLHGALFAVLAALVAIHAAAALYHHFVLRDTVLRRMIPFARVEPCRER